MANKKEIILSIDIDDNESIARIAQITRELDRLKEEQKDLAKSKKEGTISEEQYYKSLASTKAQIDQYNKALRTYKKELSDSLKAQNEQEGSLNQMRAQLADMIRAYDQLSKAEREGTGGQAMQQNIANLTREIEEFEHSTGRFGRQVGNYEIAAVSSKAALRQLKEELVQLTMTTRQAEAEIAKQEGVLRQLASTVGTDNQQYREAEQRLNEMRSNYDAATQSIQEMEQKAGQLADTIGDVNKRITSNANDTQKLNALKDGVGVLTNSYTVLQGAMAAMGLQSEELINVYAKVQLVQQSLNSVIAIAEALNKDSNIRITVGNALRKIRNKLDAEYQKQLAKQTVMQKANNVATTQAATATTGLAAAEGVATKTSFSLTAALKTVGVAIKSIPVIGWILAAVAALGTLTALIIKHNREERKGNEILTERARLNKLVAAASNEAAKSTVEVNVKMQQSVKHLKAAKNGSAEWKEAVKDVAEQLGVSETWLQKNISKVDDLVEAWRNANLAMAKINVFTNSIADIDKQLINLEGDLYRIVNDSTIKYKDRASEIAKQYKVSIKLAEDYVKAEHNYKQDDSQANYVAYSNALNAIEQSIKQSQKKFTGLVDTEYNKFIKTQNKLKQGQKDVNDTLKNTGNVAKDVVPDIESLRQQLEDLVISNMAEGIEKNIKQIETQAQRYIDTMKKAREKDKENTEMYDRIILEKQKETFAKIRKLREDAYSKITVQANQAVNNANELWMTNTHSEAVEFLRNVNQAKKDFDSKVIESNADILKQIDEIKSQIASIKSEVNPDENGILSQDEIDKMVKIKKLNDQIEKLTKSLVNPLGGYFIKSNNIDELIYQFSSHAREILMEQAGAMVIENIPDQMLTYIEQTIAELKQKLEKMQNEAYEDGATTLGKLYSSDRFQKIENRLNELILLRENINKQIREQKNLEADMSELDTNNMSIKVLQNQLATLKNVREAFVKNLEMLEEKEYKFKKRLDVGDFMVKQATDDITRQQRADKLGFWIEQRAREINELKIKMATLGFNSVDEIDEYIKHILTSINSLAQKNQKIMLQNTASMFNSINTMTSALKDLFTTIGEGNEELNNFLQLIAYAQIGTNLAVGISEAVAAGAGQPWPENLAAIASGVAAVAGAITQAFQIYKQYHTEANAPRFASGGYVSEGEPGVDRVPAWLTKGEFVIKKKRVEELGLDFLNALNNSRLQALPGHYYTGGLVSDAVQNAFVSSQIDERSVKLLAKALENVHPEVSVKEINRVQRQVLVKEQIVKK